MKLRNYLLLALILGISCVSFAADAKDVPMYRQYKFQRAEQTFDHIEKVTTVAVSQTNVLCATDIVSTNTAAVYYLPDTVVYPIELEIQTLGSIVINYDLYSTAVGTGVNVPSVLGPAVYTEAGASLVSAKSVKWIFYQKPNACFSAVTVATSTFIVRSITAY